MALSERLFCVLIIVFVTGEELRVVDELENPQYTRGDLESDHSPPNIPSLLPVVANAITNNTSMPLFADSTTISTTPVYSTTKPRHSTTTPGVTAHFSAVPRCPRRCRCHKGVTTVLLRDGRNAGLTVDCTAVGMFELPVREDGLPGGTSVLLLSSNNIQLENDFTTDLASLRELDLSANGITSLKRTTLQSLSNLEILRLERNDLSYLKNATFILLRNLTYLFLSRNDIEMMHNTVFMGQFSMKLLDLSFNRIFDLNINWFQDLESLTSMIISNNNIHRIRDYAFNKLHALRHLDLSYNRIRIFENWSFYGMISLRTLKLEFNLLKSVPTIALQKIISNFTLDLSGNRFKVLSKKSIYNSSVTEIHAFQSLPCLRNLFFRNCQLSTFEEDVLPETNSLVVVSLHNNPFICDCTMDWVKRYANTTEILATCRHPAELRGLSVGQLITETTECSARIIVSLFVSVYSLVIGDTLTLLCKAVGIPRPEVNWYFKNRLLLLDTMAPYIRVDRSGSRLRVINAQYSVHGEYTCSASQPNRSTDVVTKTTYVHIVEVNVTLKEISSTEHSITITWLNMRVPRHYQILYRLLGGGARVDTGSRRGGVSSIVNDTRPMGTSNGVASAADRWSTADIGSFVHTFTANSLRPISRYRFCVRLKARAGLHNRRPLHCIHVMTRRPKYREQGVKSARQAVVAGVATFCALLGVSCCAGAWLSDRYARLRMNRAIRYGVDADSRTFIAGMDELATGTLAGEEDDDEEGGSGERRSRMTFENRAQLVDDFNSESEVTESETEVDS